MDDLRTVEQVTGFLRLAFGNNVKWYCGYNTGEDHMWFASSDMSREQVIAWMEQTIEWLRTNEEPVMKISAK
jgi:hypothetical protein